MANALAWIRVPSVPWVIGPKTGNLALAAGSGVTNGCRFKPTVNMTVVAIGYWLFATTDNDIPVGLWNETPTLLGSGTITAATGVASDFNFVTITPVSLTSGTFYRLGGFRPIDAVNSHYYTDDGISPGHTSDAVDDLAVTVVSASLTYPSGSSNSDKMFGPVNFKYTIP